LKSLFILKEFGGQKDTNMLNIVIIGMNEGESVKNLAESLKDTSNVIYIADRCTDNSLELLSQTNFKVIDTTSLNLQGRQTSFCRNLGLKYCNPDSNVLFLDGDRYIIKGDLTDLESSSFDYICLPIEDDFRSSEEFLENQGRVYNGVFSCGIYFTRSAINKITQFQNGQLFNEDLQSYWGIEDTSLGDVCYHLGLRGELSNQIKLHGKFDKNTVDSLDVIEMRMRFRDKLNVRWD